MSRTPGSHWVTDSSDICYVGEERTQLGEAWKNDVQDAHLHLGWAEVECDEIPPEGTMNENTHCVHGLTYWVVTRSGTSD